MYKYTHNIQEGEMKINGQHMRVLQYVKTLGGITLKEAVQDLGVTCLHKRVGELEDKGYSFDRRWEEGYNRYGEKTRYKRYYLTGEPKHGR
jgi:hypothetical protein